MRITICAPFGAKEFEWTFVSNRSKDSEMAWNNVKKSGGRGSVIERADTVPPLRRVLRCFPADATVSESSLIDRVWRDGGV